MNKKILSCALVAAMLASSVGAMGVSAAQREDNIDAYKEYTAEAKTQMYAYYENPEYYGVDIYFGDVADVEEFDNKTLYVFDLVTKTTSDVTLADAEKAWRTNPTKGVQMLEAVLAGETIAATEEKWTSLRELNPSAVYENSTDMTKISSTRKAAITDFQAVVDKAEDFADNADLYITDDLVDLKVVEEDSSTDAPGYLIHDILAADDKGINKLATSEMIHYVKEYNRLLGDDGLVNQTGTWEERYSKLYDIVSILTADDYSSRNWIKVEKQIDLAEDNAAKGTTAGYKDAYYDLLAIFDLETAGVEYDNLKDALDSLFTVKKTVFDEKNVYSGTKGDKCVYLKADYRDRDGYLTDAWFEFAGNDKTGDYGAYRLAARVYNACRVATTRKHIPQSLVNYVVENLNTSIQNLDPNKETANWIIVMLEDALDIANSVVESDYRTNTSYWRNFKRDVADIEALLEATVVQENAAESAIKDLFGKDMDATKGSDGTYAELSKCKLSVPSATRNELKDKINEAKDLLKDKTGKTSTQISELQTALAEAEDITTANTISQYETAIADLDAAMTNYNHPQGWYQANGAWYYGREDANVTGWLNVSGTWYYLDPANDGRMMTGWQQIGGTWYYLKDTGAMATGWLNLNGTYYYLESWGGMATGWKSVNGSWYYLDPAQGGKMLANGWYWINGKCYYFYNWGGMAANTTINGYTVDATGAWVR